MKIRNRLRMRTKDGAHRSRFVGDESQWVRCKVQMVPQNLALRRSRVGRSRGSGAGRPQLPELGALTLVVAHRDKICSIQGYPA